MIRVSKFVVPAVFAASMTGGLVFVGASPAAAAIATTTTVQVGPNPATATEDVFMVATVSSITVPTGGSVTFYVDTGIVPSCLAAAFSGSGSYDPSVASPVVEQVDRIATSTAIASSVNPVGVGTQVIYTATVSPAVVGGDAIFYDNGSVIPGCSTLTVPTNPSQVTCTVTYSTPGSHDIIVSYTGNTDFAGSTSPNLVETVQPKVLTPTSLSLKSSANPTIPFKKVIFTASVSPAPGGGTVSFTSNGKTLCGAAAVNIVTGMATCKTSYSRIGTRTIVATYSGNTSFAGSTASTQEVIDV